MTKEMRSISKSDLKSLLEWAYNSGRNISISNEYFEKELNMTINDMTWSK